VQPLRSSARAGAAVCGEAMAGAAAEEARAWMEGARALDAGAKAEVGGGRGEGVGVHGGGQQAGEHRTRCFGVICSGASALKLIVGV